MYRTYEHNQERKQIDIGGRILREEIITRS